VYREASKQVEKPKKEAQPYGVPGTMVLGALGGGVRSHLGTIA